MSRRHIALIAAGTITVAVLVGWAVLEGLPDLLAREQGPGFGAEAAEKARSDVRTAGLQFIGGLVLALGAVFTASTLAQTRERDAEQRLANAERIRIDREGQITERFTRAIDQLGSTTSSIQLGGIYALERIAADAPKTYHSVVVEVLSAYVRDRARLDRGEAQTEPPDRSRRRRPPTDVQAALNVLGRREYIPDDPPLRLSGVDLRGASFRAGHFENARLRWADLTGAHLEGVQLQGATLRGAKLVRADLKPDDDNPQLKGANLEGAGLEGADFTGAQLRDARLTGARYDLSTNWPDGFDYEKAGAVRSDITKRRDPSAFVAARRGLGTPSTEG